MKNLFLATIAAVFFCACTVTHNYTLKENWIDDDDIKYVLEHPDIQDWFKKLGSAVVTEYNNDTISFSYNYHPHLYKTKDGTHTIKPTDDEKTTEWGERTEFIAIHVYNGKVVKITNNENFAKEQVVLKQMEEKEAANPGLIVGIIAGIAAVAAIIISSVVD